MAKTVVEELVGILGLDIDKQSFDKGSKSLENLKNQYEKVASAAQKFALASAALAGFTVVTNKLTAEQENLAAAIGISGEALDAYGALARQAGLNTDNVVDLVEELNNKLGESKGLEEITAVKEATKILGLEFEALRKLSPEEQFFKVADAAKRLEDQQAAVSAADILLGGEANKFIGFIRSQDESLQDLLETQMRLNLLTKESREEAKAFNRSFGQLAVVIGSATKQLAALMGKFLKPAIDFIVQWVSENKELSQSIVKVFSVVLPAALAVAGIAVAIMTAKLAAMSLAVLGVTWPVVLAATAFAAISAAILLVINDISTFIKHGFEAKTVIGSLITTVKEFFAKFDGMSFGEKFAKGIEIALIPLRGLFNLLNKIGNFVGEKSGLFPLLRLFDGGNANVDQVGETILPQQNLSEIPIASGAGSTVNNGGSTVNNINIDATGMAAEQLNRAIDTRVGQQNAIAANSNSTGIVR